MINYILNKQLEAYLLIINFNVRFISYLIIERPCVSYIKT